MGATSLVIWIHILFVVLGIEFTGENSYLQKVHLDVEALKDLSFDYLSSLNMLVTVGFSHRVRHDEGDEIVMFLPTYIAGLKDGSLDHLYFKKEDDHFHSIVLDCSLGDIVDILRDALVAAGLMPEFGRAGDEDWTLWVSGTGGATSMHWDPDSDWLNFLYVVSGTKRAVLVPDNRTAYVCRWSFEGTDNEACWTGIDVLTNSSVIPSAYEVILSSGDGISIPPGYWHAVENLEPTISVGYRVGSVDDPGRFAKAITQGRYALFQGDAYEAMYMQFLKDRIGHRGIRKLVREGMSKKLRDLKKEEDHDGEEEDDGKGADNDNEECKTARRIQRNIAKIADMPYMLTKKERETEETDRWPAGQLAKPWSELPVGKSSDQEL